MSDPEDLQRLAERVEALSGPDREVDIAIALAQPDRYFDAGPKYDGAPHSIGRIDRDGGHSIPGNAYDMLVPAYTASLDAAMTLVPEGWCWTVNTFAEPNLSASAYLINESGALARPKRQYIATPALALTAASLRARIGGAE